MCVRSFISHPTVLFCTAWPSWDPIAEVSDKETDRWSRVNWSWHVSGASTSLDDTWLLPICSCCFVQSLSSTTTITIRLSHHEQEDIQTLHHESLCLLCCQRVSSTKPLATATVTTAPATLVSDLGPHLLSGSLKPSSHHQRLPRLSCSPSKRSVDVLSSGPMIL